MSLGDILKFGTIFTKNKENNETVQHTTKSTGENILSYTIGDTYCDKFTKEWIESSIKDKTVFISSNFTAINNDYNILLGLHNQSDYVDKIEYRTVILTEEEWKSIPKECLEKIDWNEYPDMYVITNTLREGKIVWLRYVDGVWHERIWGEPGNDNSRLYINGFISVLYRSRFAWDNNITELGPKVYDLGPQHRPFGVRYTVKDKDNQNVTVTERINGTVIRQIDNFSKGKYDFVKIDKDLFDSLDSIIQNTVEIEANDGIHSDFYYITFRKVNSSPYIEGNFTDLGIIENKPSITYKTYDPDGDKVTIIEKINGTQIRSFTATPNEEYTVYISNEFWNNCGSGTNTVEIYAIDSFGATYKVESTFEKAASDVTYTVFYAIEGNLYYERIFEDMNGNKEARSYTYAYDTKNRYMDLNIADVEEGAEIKVWMVTHNSYASQNYKTSNVLTFKKAAYGKPVPELPSTGNIVTQDHSEYGYITVKYNHDDVEYVDGLLVSKDPSRELSDFDATIEIHCYVDGEYKGLYPLEDDTIHVGETKQYTINFETISPESRSHKITYFVRMLDRLTGIYNTNKKPSAANVSDMLPGYHYYNDEPTDPVIKYEYLDIFDCEKKHYGFDCINFYWDSIRDNDGDDSVHYMYLNTPTDFGEPIFVTSIPSRTGPNTISYTRQYKIVEKYDENNQAIGSTVFYFDGEEYVLIQENNFIGININYKEDHLGRRWPEDKGYSFVVQSRDNRVWENSYYGLYVSEDEFYKRRNHTYPDEVKLTVLPNLVDGLGDGEKGRVTVLYTHPEITDEPGTVDLYAYQDGELITKVYSGEFYPGEEQTITIDFSMYEYNTANETDKVLKRSKVITYYAVAKDSLGLQSTERFLDIPLEYIPYIVPDEDGDYGYYMVNANGELYDFNNPNTFSYEGPVQVGEHYFNEEPPAVTPKLYDPTIIGYDSVEIKWDHVPDPDDDEVKYEIYVANSFTDFNVVEKEFYSDNQVDGQDYVEGEDNERAIVSSLLKYHKVIEIPASVAAEQSQRFEISVKEYVEDSDINIWIVSKDPYINSYYRSGDILRTAKGHEAKEIRSIYPSNASTVYSKAPRILIYLGEDNLDQTVYVQWKDEIYNNRDNPEHFSNEPNQTNVAVFKPPVDYTGTNGNQVTYSVWVHNRCSYGPKKYATYTYKNFFDSFAEDKLIPIKSSHVNSFRQAINVARNAYGMEQAKFTREVRKDMLFENYDFNDTKNAIMELNDKINNTVPGEGLDYVDPLIVDVKDLDLVEYKEIVEAGSYEEFIEWARLLYILENL